MLLISQEQKLKVAAVETLNAKSPQESLTARHPLA
jgi:hypothetical protein